MIKKFTTWLIYTFNIERCISCKKKLTPDDKKNGGCGYTNGKSFSYCVSCTKDLTTDLLVGNEPDFSKLAKGIK